MLKPSDFVNAGTGKEYQGTFPESVFAPVGETVGNSKGSLSYTMLKTAKSGDAEYDDVLTVHMLYQGYVRKERPWLKETITIKKKRGGHRLPPGNIAGWSKHMANVFGEDPHFFTKCMTELENNSEFWHGEKDAKTPYDKKTRASICARAHYIVTGIWPGAHGGADAYANEGGETKEYESLLGLVIEKVAEKGGPGSGNFGHEGRPGHVGGSGGGDGAVGKAPETKPTGSVSESRGSVDKYQRESTFNRGEWEKKDFGTRMSEWDSMTPGQRDAMARADKSIKGAIESDLAFAGSRPEHDGDVQGAIEKRVGQMGDFITKESAKTIRDTVSDLDGILEGTGVDSAKRHELAMECVDALMAQEHETLKRTLGDHGVAHIVGNINMGKDILGTVPGADSAEDIAGIYIGAIFHDTGYLTEPGKVL
jgi:hypothetical protein